MSAATPVLDLRELAYGYGRREVGRIRTLTVEQGELLCLLGPNGCGKSTLLRTVLGLLPPLAGEVRLAGRALAHWTRDEIARRVACVPQAQAGLFPFRVEDVVLMGRAPHIGRYSQPSAEDRRLVRCQLERIGIGHLAEASYTEISGGERQLVLIARALVQQASLLVLDEPTASLDFGNQLQVLEHVAELCRRGITVLMSTHQPEHARRVADRVALLRSGCLSGLGTPAEMLTPARLAPLYGVREAVLAGWLAAVDAARAGPPGLPA